MRALSVGELSDEARVLVAALIAGRLAWSTVPELAGASGLDMARIVAGLADLDAGGWTDSWEEWPAGLSITFSPIASAALEIRIVEAGPEESPRWERADSPHYRYPRGRRRYRDPYASIDSIADPSPGPAELAELAEEAPPAPTLVLWGVRATHLKARNAKRADAAKAARKARRKAGRAFEK